MDRLAFVRVAEGDLPHLDVSFEAASPLGAGARYHLGRRLQHLADAAGADRCLRHATRDACQPPKRLEAGRGVGDEHEEIARSQGAGLDALDSDPEDGRGARRDQDLDTPRHGGFESGRP